MAVTKQARIVYREPGVRSIKEFAEKYNLTFPKPDRRRQPTTGKFLPPKPATAARLAGGSKQVSENTPM